MPTVTERHRERAANSLASNACSHGHARWTGCVDCLAALLAEVEAPLQARCAALESQKNDAYWERNRLAILLASTHRGRLVPANPPEPGWTHVLIFETARGQVSFHIADSEVAFVLSCPAIRQYADSDWDGHDNSTKWKRVEGSARAALSGSDSALKPLLVRAAYEGLLTIGYGGGLEDQAYANAIAERVMRGE